jgi:phosphomannomutase
MSPRSTLAAMLPGPDRSIDMPEGRYLLHEGGDGRWAITRPDGTESKLRFGDRFEASLAVVQQQV